MVKLKHCLSGDQVLSKSRDWGTVVFIAIGIIGLFCLVIATSTNAMYGGPHLIR